jgi:hypothetical protein
MSTDNLLKFRRDEESAREFNNLDRLITKCKEFSYEIPDEIAVAFYGYQIALHLPQTKFIDYKSDETRCMTYKIMKLISVNYEILDSILAQSDRAVRNRARLPNRAELVVMNHLLKLHTSLRDTAKILKKTKYVTTSSILPIVYSYLSIFPRENVAFGSRALELLKNNLVDKLKETFTFMIDSPQADFYLTSTFLDPKYKSFAFLLDQAIIDQHHAKVWDYLKANFDQPDKLGQLEEEFGKYKNQEELETAEFYEKNKVKFPLLSSLAKKMLCVVAHPTETCDVLNTELSALKGSERDNYEFMETMAFLKENSELVKKELRDFVYDPENVEEIKLRNHQGYNEDTTDEE